MTYIHPMTQFLRDKKDLIIERYKAGETIPMLSQAYSIPEATLFSNLHYLWQVPKTSSCHRTLTDNDELQCTYCLKFKYYLFFWKARNKVGRHSRCKECIGEVRAMREERKLHKAG